MLTNLAGFSPTLGQPQFEKTVGTKITASRVSVIIAMIFIRIPALIIWGIVRAPDEKTIALGGVATGNMNAQLAAKVTGTHKTSGSIPDCAAIAATTGRKVAAVAKLLASSVRNTTRPAAAATRTKVPNPATGSNDSPNQR